MTVFTRNVHDILVPLEGKDADILEKLSFIYKEVLSVSSDYESSKKQKLVDLFVTIGEELKKTTENEPRMHIMSYDCANNFAQHGQISRLIANIRSTTTENIEFTYYIQRIFELLFHFAFHDHITQQKNYIEIKTPVNNPTQNYAIHKLPDIDVLLHNITVCVMLRGALLPSMIMSKEIQEFSSIGYVSDFALFRISRDDKKNADNMQYTINESASYYSLEALHDRDLIFPDPMNATGGSILTVLEYLKEKNVRPRSIKLFHAITSLQGALQVLRAHEQVELYSLWVDPVLNKKAYIMPGLGDAGDRLHGIDPDTNPRNLLQLIANYGQNIIQLYRAQVQKIEETILGKVT